MKMKVTLRWIYEGLLEQIRAKISHYITLMVEGAIFARSVTVTGAPVPLLSSFISDCLEKAAILPMAVRVITSPAYRDRYRQPERFSPCVERYGF